MADYSLCGGGVWSKFDVSPGISATKRVDFISCEPKSGAEIAVVVGGKRTGAPVATVVDEVASGDSGLSHIMEQGERFVT